jgi:hypothetical protein
MSIYYNILCEVSRQEQMAGDLYGAKDSEPVPDWLNV